VLTLPEAPHETLAESSVTDLDKTADELLKELQLLRCRIAESERSDTEWKRAEQALRESEERFRALTQTAHDAILSVDASARIVSWNRGAQACFGYAAEEVLGRPLTLLIPERYRESHQRGLARFQSTGESRVIGKTVELHGLRKDGSEFPLELSLATWETARGRFYGGIIRDISSRKRAENRQATQFAVTRVLAESGTLDQAIPGLLRCICEGAGWEIGQLWRVDSPSNLLRWDGAWQEPAARAAAFEALSRGTSFAPGVGLPGRVWQAGQPAWIPDITQDNNFPRGPVASQHGLRGAAAFPIRNGQAVTGVIEFFSRKVRLPDGDLLKLMDDLGSQIGQFVERRRAEEALQRSQEQLRQAQKMEAVGRLAGGVAHDFNNLLTVISGYSDIALRGLPPSDAAHGFIREVRKAADRAAALTGQLLAFSRKQVLEPAVLDLNAVVAGIEKMLRRLLGEDIELVTRPGPALGRVRADRGQIEQVLLNLAVNARDAMSQGGTLTVETANGEPGEAGTRALANAPPLPYVRMTVRDTGCGMTDDVKAHLFEPFFTTKEVGKGTGLGLSTAYGIIEQSGGHIEVVSAPGDGAAFHIYLPRISEATGGNGQSQTPGSPCRGSETVLLVEDERAVREMVCMILRDTGYTVLDARHPAEALQVCERHTGPIHLVLADVVMPQMSGPSLVRRLTTLRPDIKALYMSGYTGSAMLRHGVAEAEQTLLRKPFTPDALAGLVREVLDKQNAPRFSDVPKPLVSPAATDP